MPAFMQFWLSAKLMLYPWDDKSAFGRDEYFSPVLTRRGLVERKLFLEWECLKN